MINIKIDSRKVKKGDTFVALKGTAVDGHDYIDQAIANGATKIVAEHGNYSVETIIVDNSEEWLKDYITSTYSKEVNKLCILGVTGTNGKTTTCYLTYQILNKLNIKTAYIGTIGFYCNGNSRELPNTTPNILDLYELLLEAKENGCTHVIMEVSSHSLVFERVKGLKYKTAAFTNLTEDHLDFHKTMDNYFEAKNLLLKQLEGSYIVNYDDEYGCKIKYNNIKSIGYNGTYIKIVDYKDTSKGTLINFRYNDKDYEVETNLKSTFNVYNYLTSLAIITDIGVDVEDVLNVTKNIYPPKGRCEQIKVPGGIAVVDYAHTPDAVEKIIKAFNENKNGKVITIVGCGGDRDPIKRPIMGRIAVENSDYVILTSDNPRTEDPKKIMDDILTGVHTDNYEVELDRRNAIHKALDMMNNNDILLILGKGHEDYQIIGREKIHFDDREEVENYINSKN
ncbi:MAG: UDP-N-acetylmuramoyl-L-alanyl-D-glutamate--2,6-diaminopimelate ligase [Bacilli bacterium]